MKNVHVRTEGLKKSEDDSVFDGVADRSFKIEVA